MGLANNKMIELLRTFANEIVNSKPDVLRGKERGSENTAYVVFGIKPDYHSCGVADYYVFNKDVKEERHIIIENQCLRILKSLEKCVSVFSTLVHKEKSIIGKIIDQTQS